MAGSVTGGGVYVGLVVIRLGEDGDCSSRIGGDAVVARGDLGSVQRQHGWLINGEPFSPDVAEARPALDSVEIWRLVSDFHHPVHVHLNPFQVLSRGLDGPGPYDHGWKDTIDLRPFEHAAIAVRFDGFRGRYVFHCHNLEHEDMAMMSNFVVT
jgi:spore coat protein A